MQNLKWRTPPGMMQSLGTSPLIVLEWAMLEIQDFSTNDHFQPVLEIYHPCSCFFQAHPGTDFPSTLSLRPKLLASSILLPRKYVDFTENHRPHRHSMFGIQGIQPFSAGKHGDVGPEERSQPGSPTFSRTGIRIPIFIN